MRGLLGRLWDRRPWGYSGSVLLSEEQAFDLFSAFLQALPVQEEPTSEPNGAPAGQEPEPPTE